jgi:hypothetical protein
LAAYKFTTIPGHSGEDFLHLCFYAGDSLHIKGIILKSRAISFLLLPAILSAFLLCATHADAADNYVYGQVGSDESIGFGHVLNDSFSVRAGIGHESFFSQTKTLGENKYSGRSDSTTTFDALVDWFPITGSGFRLSGGVGYNNDQQHNAAAAPDAAGNYHINGNTYSASTYGPLHADSSYRKFMPEIGVGWESATPGKEGWRFFSGLNLQFRTGGKTLLEMSNANGNSSLQQDLAAEQQRANSDYGTRSWILNAGIGAAYTF